MTSKSWPEFRVFLSDRRDVLIDELCSRVFSEKWRTVVGQKSSLGADRLLNRAPTVFLLSQVSGNRGEGLQSKGYAFCSPMVCKPMSIFALLLLVKGSFVLILTNSLWLLLFEKFHDNLVLDAQLTQKMNNKARKLYHSGVGRWLILFKGENGCSIEHFKTDFKTSLNQFQPFKISYIKKNLKRGHTIKSKWLLGVFFRTPKMGLSQEWIEKFQRVALFLSPIFWSWLFTRLCKYRETW